MIQAKELRIGNWINEQGLELQVGMINSGLFVASESVPLTEEWLLKFNIPKNGDYYIVKTDLGYEYELLWKGDGFNVYDGVGILLVFIKYVHRFQNWYYENIGSDLKIIP